MRLGGFGGIQPAPPTGAPPSFSSPRKSIMVASSGADMGGMNGGGYGAGMGGMNGGGFGMGSNGGNPGYGGFGGF